MRRISQVVVVILIVAGLGLAGTWLYQAGYAQGAAADGSGPVFLPGPGYGFGFGGLFGILGFVLFAFLLFGLLRFAFRGSGSYGPGWGGPRGAWGSRSGSPTGSADPSVRGFGPWEDRARTIHDEWHRRAEAPPTSGDRSTPADAR